MVCAAPAFAAGKHEPLVVVTTGRLIVLGDRADLREKLMRADRAIAECLRKARNALIEEYLQNARNRLDNAREFLGFEREELEARSVTKEGQEDDDRLADAVVSENLIVADLDTLWWELGRADYNLSKAQGESGRRAELLTPIEQARGDVSLAREALRQMVGLPAPDRERDREGDHERDARPPEPPSAPAPRAMADANFQAVLAGLEHEAFDNDRLALLQTVVRDQLFLVDQVAQILARFPFSDHKLRAVRLLKDRIVDTQNVARLWAAFPFDSDKDALKRILAGADVPAPQAIDNRALDQILVRLRSGHSRLGFQVLTDEAPRRWFIVDQVARVLACFPTYDERFRGLEIIRGHILDPENWSVLEPLFASPDDRARLRSMFGPRR